MNGRWRKVLGQWFVFIDGDPLPGNVSVTVAKADGTTATHVVAHSKHCLCDNGHLVTADGSHAYFVRRPRSQRSRALSFCGR